MLSTDHLLLTRAQPDLYWGLNGDSVDDLERFAERLVARVVILVRQRCVHGRESSSTLEYAERAHALVIEDPRSDAARAAIWSAVEWLTRWPWGPPEGIAAPTGRRHREARTERLRGGEVVAAAPVIKLPPHGTTH